ncbi:bacterioferritin-associated ferredoxin [Ancylobacter sp. IITR112]|uniref:(2Fe-2S)-binding protein n=1 Tax=Ancylobacter sp. IITR112 TaxID=3138073 RepID=UPI00352BD15C
MIVCSCNVLSDRQIRSAVSETTAPVRTVGQVYRCLGCSAQCGRCARTIRKLLDDVNASACSVCPRECPAALQGEGAPAPHAHPAAPHYHAPHGHAAHTHAPHSHSPHGHAHDHSHAHGHSHGHGHSEPALALPAIAAE